MSSVCLCATCIPSSNLSKVIKMYKFSIDNENVFVYNQHMTYKYYNKKG